MRLYDISLGITPNMPVWPGDPRVELKRVAQIADGDNANVSHLSCGVHVGTHVDAPIHFVQGGSGVDELPLRLLNGRAYVLHLPKASVIDEETLLAANIPPRTPAAGQSSAPRVAK